MTFSPAILNLGRLTMDGCSSDPTKLRPLGRLVASLLVAVSLLVAGCQTNPLAWWHNGFKVGPNYQPPPAPVAPEWVDAADPRVLCQPANDCAWWTAFGDPALNGLIETAYRQNLDLRTAATRLAQSQAQYNIAAANLFPQKQTAIADYLHAQLPATPNLPLPHTFSAYVTGFNVSWELDFWGHYRRLIESADANWGAAAEGYNQALVLLVSQVASNYVQLRTYEQRIENANRNVEIQRGSLQLAEDRFGQGVAGELDVRQARSNLAQTEATIPPLVTGRRQAANQLCILLGMPVSDLARQLGPAPIPRPPLSVAVGVPADLIRRRPDIRQAERQVAAQCAQIGVAEADYYPTFAVNGFVGYAPTDLKDLFAPKSFTGFVLPSATWNLLNYGRITNNVRVQTATFQRTAFQYQQTVLTAGREVEDALIGFLQFQRQTVSLEVSVREAERSVELVDLQYRGGLIDFNRVYTVQTQLVSQQDALATSRGNIALSLVQVYRRWAAAGNILRPAARCSRPA